MLLWINTCTLVYEGRDYVSQCSSAGLELTIRVAWMDSKPPELTADASPAVGLKSSLAWLSK